jgi:hypothetical protein
MLSNNSFPAFIHPKLLSRYADIESGMSTRHGGESTGVYQSFNLGYSVGDNEVIVDKNRAFFCSHFGFEPVDLAKSHQVHGNEVLVVESSGGYDGYDALITNRKGILLAVTVADCVPILIYDKARKVIAAVHAGWKGSAHKIVTKTIEKMTEEYGTKTRDIVCFVGSCIGKDSFEVHNDVAQYFDDTCKSSLAEVGKYLVDLQKTNIDQLLDLGVKEKYIEVSSDDTYQSTDLYFSHRKENGKTGRMMAAIGLKRHGFFDSESIKR